MFPTFTQAIANMKCPFNRNIAFIDKRISWAFVVTLTASMLPPTFSWTYALVFIEIKWRSLPSSVRLCLRIYSGGFTWAWGFAPLLENIIPKHCTLSICFCSFNSSFLLFTATNHSHLPLQITHKLMYNYISNELGQFFEGNQTEQNSDDRVLEIHFDACIQCPLEWRLISNSHSNLIKVLPLWFAGTCKIEPEYHVHAGL